MNYAVKRQTGRAFLYAILVVITLIVVLPFLGMFFLSFKSDTDILNSPLSLPSSWRLDNYVRAFTTLRVPTIFGNTLFVAMVTMIIEMVITFMCSFALTRMTYKSNKTRRLVYGYLLLGLAIPSFLLLFPVYRINVVLHLTNTFASLILPYIATSVSFNTLLFTGFLQDFPSEIEEAAVIDGCNVYSLCTSIIIHIVKPVLVTVFIFNVIYIWNEFPFAVTLINNETQYTISLGISMFKGRYSFDYSGMVCASLIVIIPELIFFGFFQRYIIDGMTAGAVKG